MLSSKNEDILTVDHRIYLYVIWSGDRDKIHVSCWDTCGIANSEFVLKPEKIISKYMVDGYEYTDFANNKTRYKQGNETLDVISRIEDAKHHAQKLVDLLSQQIDNHINITYLL